MKRILLLSLLVLLGACRTRAPEPGTSEPELLVAAAANLTDVFGEVGPQFTQRTGVKVVFTFGATSDLARQIENGAPFDVFASADVENVDRLDRAGLLTPGTRALYARGRLVMWIPAGSPLNASRIEDITDKKFERISIAKPDVAPYGRATVEALGALGIWNQLEPKVVYAQNVSQAKQYVATGNAEVAFIPLALLKTGEGSFIEVAENLHRPIDQALGVVKNSPRQTNARRFKDFLLSDEGQQLLQQKGYRAPTGY